MDSYYDRIISERLQARENRRKQIVAVCAAINSMQYGEDIPNPPSGIYQARWIAMLKNVCKNGEPK